MNGVRIAFGNMELVVLVFVVLVVVISRAIKVKGREVQKTPPQRRTVAERDRTPPPAAGRKRETPRPGFRGEAADHEHITTAGLSRERRLEQLDTLLEAGLLDREEYREKKQQIEAEW